MRGGTNWRSIIAAPEGHWAFAFLEVTDYDGTWVNLGNLAIGERNADFLNGYDLEDDIDRNTLTFSATLRGSVGAFSIMPFRSDSPLNVASGTYQPLLDLHRQWRLWVCFTPRGTFPEGPESYRERARGVVDRLDLSYSRDEARVQARGPEADLIDHLIIADETTPKVYAAGALPDVLQAMLDDQFPGQYTLVVDPSAPSEFIDEIRYTEPVGFWKLFSDTAAVGTGVVRFLYDDADSLDIHLFTPDRTATVPQWSVGPDEYSDIDNGLDLSTVANYIVARFVDGSGAIQTVTSPASPVSASIARYGLKTAVITLAANIGLSDATRVQAMIDAIRADKELPILGQVIKGSGLWFGELWDFVGTPANPVLYNEDQAGGVVSYRESCRNSVIDNEFTLAGKPKGRYTTWLEISSPGVTAANTAPAITSYDAAYWETYTDGVLTAGGVGDIGAGNPNTRSVEIWVGTDPTFALVEFAEYTDVTPGTTFRHQWEGASRATDYYFKAIPWSGPLVAGLPTGVAGEPSYARTYATPIPTDTPTFEWDTSDPQQLRGNVVGLDDLGGDVADLTAEPITVYDTPTVLSAARKWVDGVGSSINLSTPNEIAIDVPGASSEAAGAGSGVYEVVFFDYGSAQEPLKNIPSAFTEISSRLRRAALLAGMGTMRLVGNVVDLAGGGEKIRIGHAAAGGSSFTDPGTGADLPLNRLGVVRSDWMAVPGGMASDVDVSPHVLGGDGTRRARLTSLKLQCSPTTRAGGITPPIGSGGAGANYHYDAQALVGYSDEDPVTTWVDADNPGVSHDAVAGNGSFCGHYDVGVMNGHPGVRIESLGGNSRGYYLPSAFAPTEGEAIMVVRARAGGAFWHFGSNSFGPSIPTTSGGTMSDHFGSSVLRSFVIGIDPTVPFVYRVRAKAGEVTCWVNGVQKFTTATNTATWGVSNFGMFLSGGAFANSFDGWFGEQFFRSSHYSSTDAVALESLLFSKWGITP